MAQDSIQLSISDGVAEVTIDRPPVNAQNMPFREELIAIFDSLSQDDAVRVVILTASGKYFSAGADIKERSGMNAADAGVYARNNRLARESFFSLIDCEKPVICAVNGPALGAGVALMFCADIILATDEVYISMPEIDVGLSGGQRFLLQLLPRSFARWMYFTAARVPAADLHRMGLIQACVARADLMPLARKMAREIAGKEPLALKLVKRTFNAVEEMSVRDGYRYEQNITLDLSRTDYARDAQRGFAEKRRGGE